MLDALVERAEGDEAGIGRCVQRDGDFGDFGEGGGEEGGVGEEILGRDGEQVRAGGERGPAGADGGGDHGGEETGEFAESQSGKSGRRGRDGLEGWEDLFERRVRGAAQGVDVYKRAGQFEGDNGGGVGQVAFQDGGGAGRGEEQGGWGGGEQVDQAQALGADGFGRDDDEGIAGGEDNRDAAAGFRDGAVDGAGARGAEALAQVGDGLRDHETEIRGLSGKRHGGHVNQR